MIEMDPDTVNWVMTGMKKDSLLYQLREALSQLSQTKSNLSKQTRFVIKFDKIEQKSYAESRS